jgi:hypothetical protein
VHGACLTIVVGVCVSIKGRFVGVGTIELKLISIDIGFEYCRLVMSQLVRGVSGQICFVCQVSKRVVPEVSFVTFHC